MSFGVFVKVVFSHSLWMFTKPVVFMQHPDSYSTVVQIYTEEHSFLLWLYCRFNGSDACKNKNISQRLPPSPPMLVFTRGVTLVLAVKRSALMRGVIFWSSFCMNVTGHFFPKSCEWARDFWSILKRADAKQPVQARLRCSAWTNAELHSWRAEGCRQTCYLRSAHNRTQHKVFPRQELSRKNLLRNSLPLPAFSPGGTRV